MGNIVHFEKPLTIAELSQASGFSERQIRQWTYDDEHPLPSVPIGKGRVRMYYPSRFLRFIEEEERRADGR